MNPLYIFGGAAGLLIIYIWSLYNGLIGLKNQIEEAWSQIDVQLKRRSDLIPNLVESVKGYAKHEKGLFTEVTRARSAVMDAKTPAKMAAASDVLSGVLGRLIAVAENYPQLKANENFLQLQKELSDTEDKVAYSRQYYNTTVKDFNVKIQTFPNNMLAGTFGFKTREYFEAGESERKAVKVSFE